MEQFKELSEYLGTSVEDCEKKFSEININEIWKTRRNVVQFYKSTDFYLYDLTNFENSTCKEEYQREIENFIRKYNCKTAMDYGCGIGSEVIKLLECGMDEVTAVDIEGPHIDYMRWRLKKRGFEDRVKFITISEETELPTVNLPLVDVCICIAVLEHIERAKEALHLIAEKSRYLVLRVDPSNPNNAHPMHIEKNFGWMTLLDRRDPATLKEFGLKRINNTDPVIFETGAR